MKSNLLKKEVVRSYFCRTKFTMRDFLKFSILFCVIVLSFALAACGKADVVDLNKYVAVNFLGYDQAGTAEIIVDVDGMIRENPDAFKVLSDAGTSKDIDALTYAQMYMNGKLDRMAALSNGDAVTFAWDEDGLALIKDTFAGDFAYSDIFLMVNGLAETDAEAFDPFDAITVRFAGENGKGIGYVDIDPNAALFLNYGYVMDKGSLLSNGDIVTVTVTLMDTSETADAQDYALNVGLLPRMVTKEYVVEGLT